MPTPLFRAIDSVQLPVRDLAAAVASFDIAIGRCAVVRDPFGNPLVMVDMSRGPITAPIRT